jgi:hypothetical protein
MVAESADEELARLRRLAVVEELLTPLAVVLDVRDVFMYALLRPETRLSQQDIAVICTAAGQAGARTLAEGSK